MSSLSVELIAVLLVIISELIAVVNVATPPDCCPLKLTVLLVTSPVRLNAVADASLEADPVTEPISCPEKLP